MPDGPVPVDDPLIPRLMQAWGVRAAGAVEADPLGLAAARWSFELPELLTPALDVHCITVPVTQVERVTLVDPRQDPRGFVARRGCASILPAGEDRLWRFKGLVDIVHLYLPPALLEQAAEAAGLPGLAKSLRLEMRADDPFIGALAQRIQVAMETGEPAAKLLVQGVGLALAGHLVSRYTGSQPQRPRQSGGLTPGQLRRVEEAMRANLHRDIGLPDLAAAAGLSPFHFARAFKRSLGLAPHRYLTELRVEHAKLLLASGDLAVGEVALRCGFASPGHFAAMFRRLAGMTPAAWRRHRSGTDRVGALS